jgi:hypothetical protein
MPTAPRPCRGCQASIVLVQTPAGRWLPCEAEVLEVWVVPEPDLEYLRRDGVPVPTTRLTLVTEDGKLTTGRRADRLTPFAVRVEGREPHWARCPKAEVFRQ